MTDFKGNEPQPGGDQESGPLGEQDPKRQDKARQRAGVHVPEQMVGHHVAEAYGIPEPGIGTVVQFDSHKDDRSYAAIRTDDGWYVAGQRGRHTWSDLLADAKDPVFVMTPLAALHP